jgi:hypothetical protein
VGARVQSSMGLKRTECCGFSRVAERDWSAAIDMTLSSALNTSSFKLRGGGALTPRNRTAGLAVTLVGRSCPALTPARLNECWVSADRLLNGRR